MYIIETHERSLLTKTEGQVPHEVGMGSEGQVPHEVGVGSVTYTHVLVKASFKCIHKDEVNKDIGNSSY